MIILIPFFFKTFNDIHEEQDNEVKLNASNVNQFKKIYDSLQEGIMVLSDGKLEFFNELSTNILNEVTDMKDIVNGLDKNGRKVNYDPMDLKIFYLFDNQMQENNKKQKKLIETKVAYSLREI